MNRCVGLGGIALIASTFLIFRILWCFFVEKELKKTYCLDYKGTLSGYDLGAIAGSFFILIYYLLFVLPDCL